MQTPHVSPELLTMVLRGELPPRTLATLVRHHLSELCPECWKAFELLDGDAAELRAAMTPPAAGRPGYGEAFERAAGRAVHEAATLEEVERTARDELDELMALTPGERRDRVARARTRFRSRRLATLLLDEALSRGCTEPAESGELAELVDEVLLRMPGALLEPWAQALSAQALALRANTLRAAGDLAGADRLFGRVRSRLAGFPLDDSQTHARLAVLEASLRQEQRRLAEAEALLARAVLLYRQARDPHGTVAALIREAEVQRLGGDPEAALETLQRASGLVDAEASPELAACWVNRRAVCLCDLGRHAEAKELLAAHRGCHRRRDEAAWEIQQRWLEGRIDLGMGDLETAEARLASVRDALAAAGQGIHAALAGLDLAQVYLRQGRLAELEEIASGLVSAFGARRVEQSEIAALILFQQAVVAARVTPAVIRRLRASLEQARVVAPPTPIACWEPRRPAAGRSAGVAAQLRS